MSQLCCLSSCPSQLCSYVLPSLLTLSPSQASGLRSGASHHCALPICRFGEELTRHANFRNFGTALLTLLRIITGEAWNSIMHDCMVQAPDCDPSKQPYCALLGTDGEIMWNTTDGNLAPIAAPGVTTQENCTCESCSWRERYDIDNCGVRWAPIYFVSFFMLGAFIMLNLIIAVILENFSSSKNSSDEDVRTLFFPLLYLLPMMSCRH